MTIDSAALAYSQGAPTKYTSERNIPGAFEGETVTRRPDDAHRHGAGAVATAAIVLPALGFAAGSAVFERDRSSGRRRPPETSPTTTTSRA